jgi:hypothetical protein
MILGSVLAGMRDFSLFQNVQTSSGAHPTSGAMGIGVSFHGWVRGRYIGWCVEVTTHVPLVLRLMGGVIHLLPLYTFIVWTGTAVLS